MTESTGLPTARRTVATLSDVAALAGVSVSAVSRVLSRAADARVSTSTRERIHKAARTLDYRPNFAGRALRSARSFIIALIVPDLTNAIVTELMEGVDETALANDYMVLLGRSEDMQPGGVSLNKLVGERRVDGLLAQVSDEPTPEVVASLTDSLVPVVFITSMGPSGIGSVVLPDAAAGELAAGHLVELGHRELGMIGGVQSSYTARTRAAGFIDRSHALGVTIPDDRMLSVGYTVEDGRRGLRRLMALPTPPTAVFVANVNAGLGALVEARLLGIRVPQDLSIIAIHDAWTADYSWPPLTTVKMPLRQLGVAAVHELLRRLADPAAAPQNVLIEDPAPELIVRESTRPFEGAIG